MVVLDIQLILCIFAFAITITNGGGGGKKEKVHIKIHVPKLIHHEKHVKTIYIHVHHKADPPKHKGHDHHEHHSHHSGHEHHSHHDGHKHHHHGGHHGGHMGGGGGGHGHHHHHGHGGGGHKMMHGGKKHMGGGKKKGGDDHHKKSIITYSYGHGKRGHSFTNVKPVMEHYMEGKNYGPVTFEQMMMQQQQQKQEDPFGTYEFDAFSVVDGPAGNYEQPPVDSYGQVQQDDGYAKAAALRNGGNDIHMYHYPPLSSNQMAVMAKKAPDAINEEYTNFIEEEHSEHGHDAEDEVHREKGDYHNEEYNHIDKEAEGEHGKYNKGGYKKKTKNSKYEKLFDQHSGGYLEY